MNGHNRRSIRLKGYDYSQAGAYFVTVCTRDRECLFGKVADGQMRLNEFGEIVSKCWVAIPDHFEHVALDTFVIMPNHVHGIIFIAERNPASGVVGARHAVPLQIESFGRPVSGSIPTVIRSFKSAVAKRINELRQPPGIAVWQRNHHERVIRNEKELNNMRQYILDNPLQWETDPENPAVVRDSLLPKLMSGKIRIGRAI